MAHILNAAKKGDDKGRLKAIKAPDTLMGPLEHTPIRVNGLLRQEGLYDVFRSESEIACSCMFKPSGWAKGRLSLKGYFCTFDLPLVLDKPLAKNPSACNALTLTMSLVVVSAIFEIIWSLKSGGLEMGAEAMEHSIAKALPNEMKDEGGGEEWMEHRGSENHQQKANDCTNQAPNSKCKDSPSVVDLPSGNAGLRPSATPAASHTEEVAEEVESVHKSRLDRIKREHNLAKAMKSNNAEVPIHIWDEAICRAKPPQELRRALEVLRAFLLRVYRRRLLKDVLGFLGMKYGGMKRIPPKSWCFADPGWRAKAQGGPGGDRQAPRHQDVMQEIVWRAANKDWFEYPSGSRLHYFHFPVRYQQQVSDEVGVFFKDAGPSMMRAQPPLGIKEREVLSKKIMKFIKKGYIALPTSKIKSLIKYFAVPKGVLDDVVQDWRIVFHAGANKLNDSVWAPSFSLPTMNSLLWIVDSNSIMEDRDIGEMFLNFQLDPRAMQFAAIDLEPLKYSTEECGHRWMSWT